MLFDQLFARKSLDTLLEEAKGENRLRRILGPIGLTSLGVGAIIGAGIFVMTGRAAAQDAGPAIILSYVVAGIGCAMAALCYAEFAAMAPVAGSAYTYAYATLGELLAWIIGWDLILEYAMACACVASSWSKYLNQLLKDCGMPTVPGFLIHDPFSGNPGDWFNLPAALIILFCTIVLVIGIRESATTNAILVGIKVGVVLFVIVVGCMYISTANWTSIPVSERLMPEEALILKNAADMVSKEENLTGRALEERVKQIKVMALAEYRVSQTPDRKVALQDQLPKTAQDRAIVEKLIAKAKEDAPAMRNEKWGILALVGLDRQLSAIDDSFRTPFTPYGFSGIMLGAAIVFFAYIGFDSISTHAEEAIRPQRDVPFGILASLIVCTVLYIAVSAVITGMVPFPQIDQNAAIASAFSEKAQEQGQSPMLRASAVLIAAGGLAGMTSVLLITFLSQARIFLAMARDGLMPPSVFGAVHHRFRTPHLSTMLTGGIIAIVAAFTPITKLEEMVNIGTLMAFVIVCGAVLLLRIRRPDAERPFRAPLLYFVAPFGIAVNFMMMLFLPIDTWLRLVVWLVIGLIIYFGYGLSRSTVGKQLRGLIPAHMPAVEGSAPTNGPTEAIKRAGTDIRPKA
jgi:APA family basic amino acid/polyamine antiporter